jgi:hypothetical protein
MQRCCVHQHEVSPTIRIDRIKAIVDTIHIIRNRRLIRAAVRQESIAAKIIGANPHRIDRVVALPVRVQCVRVRGCIDVFAVCNERVHFVNDVWKRSIDGCKVAVYLVVVTDCAGDRVIVEHRASVV